MVYSIPYGSHISSCFCRLAALWLGLQSDTSPPCLPCNIGYTTFWYRKHISYYGHSVSNIGKRKTLSEFDSQDRWFYRQRQNQRQIRSTLGSAIRIGRNKPTKPCRCYFFFPLSAVHNCDIPWRYQNGRSATHLVPCFCMV